MSSRPDIDRTRTTIHDLARLRARGERFVMLTAYDANAAGILDELDVPVQEFGISGGKSDAAAHLGGVRPYFPRLGPVQQKLQPTVVQLQSARWPRVGKGFGSVGRRDVGAVPGWCWKASWSRTRRQRGHV